jgi:Xaa-Pro dipeptidase
MLNSARLARVQDGLRSGGVAAFLILTHDDYIWIFGEDRFQPRAIVPAAGPPIVVCFRGEAEEISASLGVKDVRVFATVGQQIKDVVEVMRSLFAAAGAAPGKGKIRVGVRLGFSTPAFLLDLFQKANAGVEVVDVAPVMDPLRAIKEPEELALMRRAAAVAASGMEAAARALRPGATESEVAGEAEYAMRRAGGQGTATPVYVNSGARSRWLHGTASDKAIEKGDLVVVDLVPRVRGYCANLCRTFVVGEPTGAQKRLLDAYLEAQAAAVGAMRPGVPVRDVDAAAQSALDRAGFGALFVPGISHGIGLEFEEWPMPTIHMRHQNAVLQEGMTLTAGHSVLADPGVGGARFEDTFLLAAAGAVPLTKFPFPISRVVAPA